MSKTLEPLRIGDLAWMLKSPAHCRHAIDHPSPPTAAMRLGSMAHSIMLGKNVPVVYPGPVRRGKEYEKFKAAYPDEEVIYLESEVTEAKAIARSLMDHGEAVKLLFGRREETILWEFNGRPCRGTPDSFNTKESILCDLKTTVDASQNRFPWQALKLGYHAKLMWYMDGLKAAGVAELQRAFIVAVENKPPYAVTTYELTERAMDFGRRLYSSWLQSFLVCEQSNEWPGYPLGVLDAPEDDFTLTIDGEEVEVA